MTVLVNGGLRCHTVPKVASTSMSAAMIWDQARRVPPNDPGEGWRFMAVRHPLDRMVSAWRFFTPRLKHLRVFKHNIRLDMPFAEFVDVVLKHPELDRHTRPQVQFKGKLPIDQLVKLENLPKEWAKLVKRFPVHPIPHKNKTDHAAWTEYYDPPLACRVLAAYEADMELFENAA